MRHLKIKLLLFIMDVCRETLRFHIRNNSIRPRFIFYNLFLLSVYGFAFAYHNLVRLGVEKSTLDKEV